MDDTGVESPQPLRLIRSFRCRFACSPALQKRTRFENEKYLRSHPELGELIQDFIVDVLEKRPANIEDAAVAFFVEQGAKRSAQQKQREAAGKAKP